MKKSVLNVVCFFIVSFCIAQKVNEKVGDNPTIVNSSAIYEVESTTRGFLPPRMTSEQRDAIVSPATGLILFNLTENCLQINTGTPLAPIWPCIIGSNSTTAVLTTLDCAGATHNGTLTSGTAASGVSSVIAYTGGNGGTYAAQTITSTGVTGLTATLTAGTLASGAGTITYTITGTPAASGTASFAISLGGQSCTLTRTVDISMTPIATVSTLDCAGATHNGTLTSGTAASGVSSVIAYTGGNGGTYVAQTITSTGVTGLTATLTAGTLASGAGTITYTITGTPAASGTASFAISLGGQSCTLTRTVDISMTPIATVSTLDCAGATHNGTLTSGTAASGVSSVIAYTGGNGGTYAAQTITSTGVTGLTATLTSGTLASGAGTVTYTITGTPAASGTASFAISLGGQSCTLTRTVDISMTPIATVSTLDCAGATHNGTLTSGSAASSVSSVISYTGGNGGTYTAQTITSTGVTGLTATLTAGTLASGAGTVTYTITGTPAASGTASFAISLGGQSCTLTRTIALPAATITALDCTGATHNGTLTSGTAASGVSSVIAYTGGNGGTYAAQSITSTGVIGLTATLTAGTLASGAGTVTYTITGTPTASGTASFAISLGEQSCTLTRTIALPAATITALDCTGATHNGTLTSGTAASGVSSVIAYTGGNGGTYAAQTITSTGVTGLTATLTAGTLASGAGTITYTITGTPATSGTASFAISLGGQSCTLTRTVALPAATITALDCTGATHNGTLTSGTAASGVSSVIAYTGGNGGTYAAQTITSTGVTGLTATLTAGTLASGAGTITYTITGTPAASGTASFAISLGGQSCTLTRTVALPAATITALDCTGATHNGTLTSGTAASGVSSVIAYTGGNGGTYTAQTITSTGVTGLTATLTAGTLASGAGTVTYTITGTPAASGTASFAISLGGQSCTLTRTIALPAATITALDCTGATHNGTLTSGTAASGVSSVIAYTGGNGGTYAAQSITSTGVIGLTATLTAGTLASGAGTVTYTITGTPTASGTASFAISLGEQSCTLTRTIALPAATITALDCTGATHNGTLTSGTAASGVSSVIAYTGGNGGTYAAQTITSTGVTGLTATLTAGTLASGAGTITYTITGTPATSGTASFAISLGGQSCTLTRTVALPAATITALDCAGATHNGTLLNGTAASSASSVISYTGGNGGTYATQTITSTGVTGLTATLTAGTIATGVGTLTYTITGTPVAGGTASFEISLGGQTCTLTRTVDYMPSTITLFQNLFHIEASAFDQDYLPYTAPTTAASTSTQAADGVNEAFTINLQGRITTTGISIRIPVTATASGTLPSYTSTSVTVPANLTEDGISRNIFLSWAAQAYTSTTQNITATIVAVDGTLNIKKLDVNAGIGNDVLGVLIGALTYPYDRINTTTYSVRAIPVIPDRMFGVADNAGSTTSHRMLYLPITAADGNIWLNHNLGAHYTNINHASFNLAQQATSATDHLAYGSYFQWGRSPDGHELITFTSSTTGTSVYGTTTTRNNTPTDALFITTSVSDWRTTANNTLWSNEASANNPCPRGFRVPTRNQMTNLSAREGINGSTIFNSSLRFTYTGFRDGDTGSLTALSSSSVVRYNTSYQDIGLAGRWIGDPSVINLSDKTNGGSIRCIRN